MGTSSNIVVFLWICLLASTPAEVILRGEWKENLGWHVSCDWQTLANDSLLFVRMYRNDVQFVVYKPGEEGGMKNESLIANPDLPFMMSWLCISHDKRRGRCLAEWRPNVEVSEDTYRCEVSGERPKFRWEEDKYTLFAPPTAAIVKEVQFERKKNRIQWPTINCTSSGLPPPRLIWTVEGQKIPEEFTRTRWNSTTKLWDSWSSCNPQDLNAMVVCTPVAVTQTGRRVAGLPAAWPESNNSIRHGAEKYIVSVFAILAGLLFR